MKEHRLRHLTELLRDSEFDTLALAPGPTLYYLSGLQFHLSERPILGVFFAHSPPVFILPELESQRLISIGWTGETITYGERPESLAQAMHQVAARFTKPETIIGVEPLAFRAFELWLLEEFIDGARLRSAAALTTDLRLSKSAEEIAHIRQAVDIAQNALEATLPLFKVNMTERELAAELTIQLIHKGSAPDFPFQPIVASGPNSALPHATPSDRKIQEGDSLILDWGARFNGYISDITRTFAVGEADPEFQEIHSIVLQANEVGRKTVKPGVTCDQIDRAAREVIDTAGYGEWFIHRTGHGFGLEPHEPPSLYSGNVQQVEAGMVFTIEPGIYLPGKAGVRIEDNLALGEQDAECLTSLPRELQVIG